MEDSKQEKSNSDQVEQINLLQKQIDQIQLKVFSEQKSKWYKSPSLILSIIALSSSLYFTTKSIIENKDTKQQQTESAIIQSIKQSITNLLIEEEKLIAAQSNQYTDLNAKNSAYMIFQAKSGPLIEKISISLNDKRIDKIEPSLLINYGRFLTGQGDFSKAHWAFENSLKATTNTMTMLLCYRYLANIIANPSYENFDSLKSRDYRWKTVQLAKRFSGELKNDYLSRSYELWAIDEYYFFKNKQEGNRLIDSSKLYVQKFKDLNTSKVVIMNRLIETYNYYNEILVTNNLAGVYSFYSSDKKNGKAYISTNNTGGYITLDLIKDRKLNGRISGSGNLISIRDLKFEVSIVSQSSSNGGTLILSTSENRKLIGYLYEFGKEPVKYYLTKRR
jgi:hypothetical protein